MILTFVDSIVCQLVGWGAVKKCRGGNKKCCGKVWRNQKKGITLHSLSGTEVPPETLTRQSGQAVPQGTSKKKLLKILQIQK